MGSLEGRHRLAATRCDLRALSASALAPRHRPIGPGHRLDVHEPVAHARLLGLDIKAGRAELAPAVQHDRTPGCLGLDQEADRAATSALVASVGMERPHHAFQARGEGSEPADENAEVVNTDGLTARLRGSLALVLAVAPTGDGSVRFSTKKSCHSSHLT